jgi:hypothetical protein
MGAFALSLVEMTAMKRLLILTAVGLMLAMPGCRGMRGASCGIPEPVCGSPGFVEGSYLPPVTGTSMPAYPGPYETLPPTVQN